MRFLVKASVPVERGNDLIRAGKLGSTIGSVLADLKPEAAYFTAVDGERTAYLIVDIPGASDIPRIAEPLFLAFDGSVEFLPAMIADDLMTAEPDIRNAAEKYGSL